MHMADALLSPSVGTAFWAGTIAAIGYASKKLKESLDDRLIPLMGVLGAFVFAAQMINFAIPGTGASGHLSGGMLLSILIGPHAAFLVMASVLTVQALFFADGGLLALGCNIWNLAFYPCFIAYPLIYTPLARAANGPKKILLASLLSSIAALQIGAFSVVMLTMLSGRSELPFGPFALVMQPIHLAIGIVEGVVTAGVINYVRLVRPEMLDSVASARPMDRGLSLKKVVIPLGLAALITGGILSWFASTQPDGLEWSLEKVLAGNKISGAESRARSSIEALQEKTALMPDYSFRKKEDDGPAGNAWPAVEAGTSAAGVIGAAVVLFLVFLLGVGIRLIRRRPS